MARLKVEVDFQEALEAIDQLLVKYHPLKGNSWDKNPIVHLVDHQLEHTERAVRFLSLEDCPPELGCEEDIVSNACRAIMGLQRYLENRNAEPE